MKLKEYQGKRIFAKEGLPVPEGYVIRGVDEIKDTSGKVVLKAQILEGGRCKSGLVQFADEENIGKVAFSIFSKDVSEILVEEAVDIEAEFYISIAIDRFKRKPVLIFCKEGGIDIEEVSKISPEKVKKYYLNDGFSFEDFAEVNELDASFVEKLIEIFRKYDAELVEINPLAMTKDGFVALDSKFVIDDNALYRHSFNKTGLTDIEKKAVGYGLNYVDLEGNIGIIGNGAGLVMSTLDVVDHFGGDVANFLDLGGGTNSEHVYHALEILMMKKPKGIFINIFGGITRCDEVAKGLIDFNNDHKIDIPLVIRITGTNEEMAKEMLTKAGFSFALSMDEGAKKIVEAVR